MGYLDPGIFGILSQVGLAILLIVVSAFTFFLKPIKNAFKKIFKKKADPREALPVDDQPSH